MRKSVLKEVGLIKKQAKASSIFESLFGEKSFFDIEYKYPCEYIAKYWEQYKKSAFANTKNTNSLNGTIFEYIIQTLFIRENLLPLYIQAKVAFVPNVEYDSILYSKEIGPIAFSMKTSLRERYKQADLEAIALKYVHRKARCFLLTLSEEEYATTKKKIADGDIIGLDKVILCTSPEMNQLIFDLKQRTYALSEQVEIVSGTHITSERINRHVTNSQ